MFAVVVSSFLRYHRTVTNGSAAAYQTDDDIAVDELMTGSSVIGYGQTFAVVAVIDPVESGPVAFGSDIIGRRCQFLQG